MSELKRLTVNDPVSREELDRIGQIDLARAGIADKNLMLDQEKIRLLAAARRLDEQYQSLFKEIVVARGLPEDTKVEVNMNTGAIKVVSHQEASSEEV